MIQNLRRFDTALGTILEDAARIMFFIFSAAACVVCLLYQLRAVSFRYSLDYGEAPLVDQAMRLASGQNIYRSDLSTPPYTISNYPPLYVTLIAVILKLLGVSGAFHAGRIISALAAWTAVIFLVLIVYAVTRDHLAALTAGLALVAFPFFVYWSPLLRIDMLALALSLAGLCVLVWEPVTSRRLVAVALLLLAAIYTRQSYGLAAPLAAFVWLLPRDWRQAIKLVFIIGGVGSILFLVLNLVTHGGFFFNIVTANVNEFQIDLLKFNWERVHKAAVLLLGVGCFSLLLIPRWNPLWLLAAPYLVGATLSAVTVGKIGSNVNYLLELCAALSLAAGVVVAWSHTHLPFHFLRAAVTILLAFGVVHMVRTLLVDYTWDLRERQTSLRSLSELETLVAETPGSILADEYMGMLTLQNRPLVIQPFEVTQLARAGNWDQTPFLNSIQNKEFSSIIIYDRPWSSERWTPEMLQAIDRSYRLVKIVAENKVYQAVKRNVAASTTICPGAGWQLPSDSTLGVQWQDGGLDFLGQGNEGKVAVRAVADGLLLRRDDWVDAVAILHDDPLHPGQKIWSYYSDLAAANGTDSFIGTDFPPGSSEKPVKAGQLLGYQGTWSGTPFWPKWMHVHFAVVGATNNAEFPQNLTLTDILDPTPYLNLNLEARTENENTQLLKCGQP